MSDRPKRCISRRWVGREEEGGHVLKWIDYVKDAYGDSRMGLATARWKCRNRSEWRGVTDKIL